MAQRYSPSCRRRRYSSRKASRLALAPRKTLAGRPTIIGMRGIEPAEARAPASAVWPVNSYQDLLRNVQEASGFRDPDHDRARCRPCAGSAPRSRASSSVALPAEACHPHVRFDARQQFAGAERLDEVVVGAGLHAFDAALLAGARREQDDRQRARLRIGAQPRQQLMPSRRGIMMSESTQIGPARGDGRERRFAVRDRLDLVARGQQAAHIVAHVGVVVGEEDARHVRSGHSPARAGDVNDPSMTCSSVGPASGQPAQRLFDEGRGAERRGGLRTRRADLSGSGKWLRPAESSP